MMEKRLTVRMIDLWELTSKGEPPPEFLKFNTGSIQDIWQQCISLSIEPNGNGKIIHLGKQIAPFFTGMKEGSHLNAQMKVFPGARMIKHVPDILVSYATLTDEGQFVGSNNKVVKYRSCLLPFGNKDGVTHVILGVSWREF